MRIKKLNIVDGGRWKNGINAISHHENYGHFSLGDRELRIIAAQPQTILT